ncbi:hypothetical protein BOQ07_26380 [Klebsiella michiganensis]|nr:hypothetical protein KONIH1_12915 [Klebsiella oxytoca KONIH1]KFC35172.1 hypothetical protein FF19_22280 [Klebsiella michiganensis]OLU16096.1 hypothetical protein BOQ07_26380 [Klebsiella michiganensis]
MIDLHTTPHSLTKINVLIEVQLYQLLLTEYFLDQMEKYILQEALKRHSIDYYEGHKVNSL